MGLKVLLTVREALASDDAVTIARAMTIDDLLLKLKDVVLNEHATTKRNTIKAIGRHFGDCAKVLGDEEATQHEILTIRRGDAMATDMLVPCVPMRPQLLRREPCPLGVAWIVVARIGMAIEAERYGILKRVCTTLTCRDDVVNLNANTFVAMADGTVSCGSNQSRGPYILRESHHISFGHLTWRSTSPGTRNGPGVVLQRVDTI